MSSREKELTQLLSMLAEHVDLEHCRKVDERYQSVFNYERVETPILVVQSESMFGSADVLPAPWNTFKYYSYADAFYDPVAMMQNQLLDRVVPGVILKDDNPLSIRNNHGGIQIASILGARWNIYEDNFPWVQPITERAQLEDIAASTATVGRDQGSLPQAFNTLEFFGRQLDRFPPLADAVQISVPDLQGPMDIAEQLWGSGIYYAFYDARDLLERLLSRIVEVIKPVFQWFCDYSTDRLAPQIATQHGYMIPGRFLLRDDSSIPLSPSMYEDIVRPIDARLTAAFGKVSLHSCGKWDHLIDSIVAIPGLAGLDPGNPEMMDIQSIYARCREKGIAITNLLPAREDLVSGKAVRDFPTGVVFVYAAQNYADAQEVAAAYYGR